MHVDTRRRRFSDSGCRAVRLFFVWPDYEVQHHTLASLLNPLSPCSRAVEVIIHTRDVFMASCGWVPRGWGRVYQPLLGKRAEPFCCDVRLLPLGPETHCRCLGYERPQLAEGLLARYGRGRRGTLQTVTRHLTAVEAVRAEATCAVTYLSSLLPGERGCGCSNDGWPAGAYG